MKHNYPTIYVHGLGGFGEGTGLYKVVPQNGIVFDLGKKLRKNGYEVYCPEISAFAGAWDRSCELWAVIMGGTVDYGKVHSEKYGHERFGRTYPGLVKDWGTPGDHEKINIIGHSFGGPVVKMFSQIINYGAQEEVDGTDPSDLSPFFKLSKPQKVHSATTMTGVNNGTLLASVFGKRGMTLITYVLMGVAGMIGDTFVQKVYDFGLDEWGLTEDPATCHWFNFRSPFKFTDAAKRYNAHVFDSVAYEMQIENCQDIINPAQKEAPDQYYFARRGNRSWKFGPIYLPTKNCTFPNFIVELVTGNGNIWPHLKKYGVDESWRPNDGMVNVIGQSAPLTAKYEDYVEGMDVKPGQWYNFPVEDKDHFSWAGWFENPTKYYEYNKNMIEFLNNLD